MIYLYKSSQSFPTKKIMMPVQFMHFCKIFLPNVKELISEISQAFYWTDSPTSQSRNKSVFQIISTHKKRIPMLIRSVGITFKRAIARAHAMVSVALVKRLADDSVAQNKVVIQDPLDLFYWSQETQYESKIKYRFVSSEERKVCKKLLQGRAETLKPITGTMKVHSVNGLDKNKAAVRNIQLGEKSCCDRWPNTQSAETYGK